MIGGQHNVYLLKQLIDFREDDRANSPNVIMNKIVRSLSNADLDALAEHIPVQQPEWCTFGAGNRAGLPDLTNVDKAENLFCRARDIFRHRLDIGVSRIQLCQSNPNPTLTLFFLNRFRRDLLQMLNFAFVIQYGSVTGKLTADCRVNNTHTCPALSIKLGLCHFLPGFYKAAEICRCKAGVARAINGERLRALRQPRLRTIIQPALK